MKRLRNASTRRLLAIAATLVVVAAGAGIAQAALTGPSAPPAKPLDQAVYDAVKAPPVAGITARIHFTNNLLPAGSLPQDSASPVLTGADGRLWLAQDGRVRLELQSDAGDAQITSDGTHFTIYDATSKTAYEGTLPQGSKQHPADKPATLAGIQQGLENLAKTWTLSGATPTTTGNRPSYTLRIAPKDDGGLLGAAQLAWDAETGVPLRAAVYAQGSSSPVLELTATHVDYGPIAASDLNVAPPAGTKVVEINPPAGHGANGATTQLEGAQAVQQQLDFTLSAPATLAGLPRRQVSLVKDGGEAGALVSYGQGLGAIAVFEHKQGAAKPPAAAGADPGQGNGAMDLTLPQVNIDGATGSELATALGTMVSFDRGGVSYTVIGSVPPVSAENAARALG